MNFEWDEEKNAVLKHERGVCFEDIIIALQTNKLIAVKEKIKVSDLFILSLPTAFDAAGSFRRL